MSSSIDGKTGRKLGGNSRVNLLVSQEFNIDNGSGTAIDEVLLVTPRALTITKAYRVYTEATDTAGAEGANTKLGSTLGGVDIVASTALTAAKSALAREDLTLVSAGKKVAAGGAICVRHTGIAATEAGKYRVVVEYTFDK